MRKGSVIEITGGRGGVEGARVKGGAEENRTVQKFTRPRNRTVQKFIRPRNRTDSENRGVRKRASGYWVLVWVLVDFGRRGGAGE